MVVFLPRTLPPAQIQPGQLYRPEARHQKVQLIQHRPGERRKEDARAQLSANALLKPVQQTAQQHGLECLSGAGQHAQGQRDIERPSKSGY